MKGTFRIGGAALLGVLIVLMALYVSARSTISNEAQAGTVISASSARVPIETKDENMNGIPDWEETLTQGASARIIASTSTLQTEVEPYTPPTTLTGKFSEAFLKDYLQGKMRGVDFSDPTAFIDRAISTIEASTASRKHTRAEITLIKTNIESLRSYGNELVDIMNRNTRSQDVPLAIVQQATAENDPEILKGLEVLSSSYEAVIAETLSMHVPDLLAVQHINLLNAYEAILADLNAMRQLYDDPLLGLARLRAHEHNIEALTLALKEISEVFTEQRIFFTQEEPGRFFYIFDAL